MTVCRSAWRGRRSVLLTCVVHPSDLVSLVSGDSVVGVMQALWCLPKVCLVKSFSCPSVPRARCSFLFYALIMPCKQASLRKHGRVVCPLDHECLQRQQHTFHLYIQLWERFMCVYIKEQYRFLLRSSKRSASSFMRWCFSILVAEVMTPPPSPFPHCTTTSPLCEDSVEAALSSPKEFYHLNVYALTYSSANLPTHIRSHLSSLHPDLPEIVSHYLPADMWHCGASS